MKTDLPLVSVAMPVYNAEKYLEKAINSVLNQTYAHFELIIVNDASIDGSREIIFSYSDPRIRYVENEENLGISKTRNRCVQLCQGKYIAVLDNDDIALPNRLEDQVRFLEANSLYGACGSFYHIVDASGKIIKKVKLPITDRQVKTYLLFDNCFCNSTIMIRAQLLKERMYTEAFDMIEDYHFLYTISKSNKLFNLPNFTTQYRVHGKNASIEKNDGMRMLHAKMDRMILNDLKMPFTEEEFNLHTNFVTGNFSYFENAELIDKLEAWLIRLYRLLESRKTYNMGLIKRFFIRRWILIFRRTKVISSKMVFNKLFWKFPFKYAGIFLVLLVEKHFIFRSKA